MQCPPAISAEPVVCLRDVGFDVFGLTNYEKFLNKIFNLEALKLSAMVTRVNKTAETLEEFNQQRVKSKMNHN